MYDIPTKFQYGVVSTALSILASGTVCAAELANPQTVLDMARSPDVRGHQRPLRSQPGWQYVLRTFVDGNQALLRLPDGSDDEKTLAGGVANFERAAWCGNELLRVGTQGTERHWFASSAGVSTVLPTVPPDAMAVCSADGSCWRTLHPTPRVASCRHPSPSFWAPARSKRKSNSTAS